MTVSDEFILTASDFTANKFYLVRVGSRPILAFPNASKKLNANFLSCYPADTFKRKLIRAAMQISVSMCLSRILWKKLSSPVEFLDASALQIWTHELCQRFNSSSLYPVFVWPADVMRGRIYIHLLDKTGLPIAFVKISLDKISESLLYNELRMLNKIASFQLKKSRVPEVFGSGYIHGNFYIIVQYVPRKKQIQKVGNGFKLEDIVLEYSGKTWNMSWNEIERSIWWKNFTEDISIESELIELMKESALTGIDVRFVHGDLNTTNLLYFEDVVWLLDWERAYEAGPYLTDIICVKVDELWHIIQKNISLAIQLFCEEHWNNRCQKYRLNVLFALAFLQAVDFTPAIELLKHWKSIIVKE